MGLFLLYERAVIVAVFTVILILLYLMCLHAFYVMSLHPFSRNKISARLLYNKYPKWIYIIRFVYLETFYCVTSNFHGDGFLLQ